MSNPFVWSPENLAWLVVRFSISPFKRDSAEHALHKDHSGRVVISCSVLFAFLFCISMRSFTIQTHALFFHCNYYNEKAIKN